MPFLYLLAGMLALAGVGHLLNPKSSDGDSTEKPTGENKGDEEKPPKKKSETKDRVSALETDLKELRATVSGKSAREKAEQDAEKDKAEKEAAKEVEKKAAEKEAEKKAAEKEAEKKAAESEAAAREAAEK